MLLAVSSEVKETLSLVETKLNATFLWATVAFVGLLAAGALMMFFFDRSKLKAYGRVVMLLGIGFALAIGVVGLATQLIKYDIRGGFAPALFYPVVATVVVAIVCGFGVFVVNMAAKDKTRLATLIGAGLTAVPLVVSLVEFGIYYTTKIREEGYYVDVSTLALVLSCVGLVAVSLLIAVLCGKKEDKAEHTRSIAYAGVCVALAFALSYIKLFRMPQGGSVTLASMLPIMLYSCRFGTRKGLLVGFIYGLMQAIQDPYIIHPAQFLLDYPVAFAMLGLAGWAADVNLFGRHRWASLLTGCISAFFLRYVAHVLSGIFAFAAYAYDAGAASVTLYSFAYNSYVMVDGAMCLALGILMYLNKGARPILFGVQTAKEDDATQENADGDTQENADDAAQEGAVLDADASDMKDETTLDKTDESLS